MKLPYLLLCLLLFLSACSSTPTEVYYYRLNPSFSESSGSQRTKKPSSLIIERITVASFLRQSGLVMQLGDNRLHISKRHLWAEDLTKGIEKALQKSLQHQNSDYTTYIKAQDWVKEDTYRLRLRLDSLHANDQGEVVAEGRYQITDTNLQHLLTRDFYFTRDLTQDGYAQSVKRIEQLITDIAEDITHNLGAVTLK